MTTKKENMVKIILTTRVNLDTAKIVTAKISNKRETGRGLHGRARR
jgi:hypothetical protein